MLSICPIIGNVSLIIWLFLYCKVIILLFIMQCAGIRPSYLCFSIAKSRTKMQNTLGEVEMQYDSIPNYTLL